jgi:hypothetical protein
MVPSGKIQLQLFVNDPASGRDGGGADVYEFAGPI